MGHCCWTYGGILRWKIRRISFLRFAHNHERHPGDSAHDVDGLYKHTDSVVNFDSHPTRMRIS
jgi:hypothetical protein